MPRRKAIGDLEEIDVECCLDTLDDYAEDIATALATKGFCTIEGFSSEALQRQVLAEVEDLRVSDRFYQPPDEIAAGLLGAEGSAQIANLRKFSGGDGVATESAEGLREVDTAMGELCSLCREYSDILGFEAPFYSTGVVHEAGVPDQAPVLRHKDIDVWLDKFLRHKVMAISFFGPMEGVLRLQVYGDEEAEMHEVLTKPGMLVLLRPDLMSHEHVTLGKAIVVSSFFLDAHAYHKRHPEGGWILCPHAVVLDRWAMKKLEALKSRVRDDGDWDPDIPREWQRAMNLNFFTGHMTAITGLSGRFPGSWDVENWFKSQAGGPDTVIAVPIMRWDHSQVYDESPDCWKRGKTFSNHGGFMDGADLFDNKFFGISIAEAKGMDPNQRHLLEVSYDALFRSGQTKRSLMNSPGSVYAGNQAFEIAFVEVPQECRGCGPTGGAGCIAANRISYLLGMKGPSMGVDTDTASSISALYLTTESIQRKGRGKAADYGVALGCATMLTPLWWHQHVAMGWMTFKGRCLTFDASASGYVRAEACAGVALRLLATAVDDQVVVDEKSKIHGMIAGCSINSNGCGAGLAAPNGEAEQELVAESIRNAGICALDVDQVETHGYGSYLGDVVEVSSLMRAHRRPDAEGSPLAPLSVTSAKTLSGHTMETCGIASLLRVVLSAQYGVATANLHLRVVNPHMDIVDAPISILTESLDLWRLRNFSGVLSKGFNGTNGYCVAWGTMDSDKVKQSPGLSACRPQIHFWPGGGGELEPEQRPMEGYCIVGSWGEWRAPEPMEEESCDVFGCTVTLGANGWEQFQIWLDGDPQRVLHPGLSQGPRLSPVEGPDEGLEGGASSWLIDGSGSAPAVSSSALARGETTPDSDAVIPSSSAGIRLGRPGDRYRVRLSIAGKWRSIDWERLERTDTLAVPSATLLGRYYVTANWNSWDLDELEPDTAEEGLFSAVVQLSRAEGAFQILRNRDWSQVFHPSDFSQDPENLVGPDDGGYGLDWFLGGEEGDFFRLEFRRQLHDGVDRCRIAWERLAEVE
mmetsp:Transcript_130196/g.417852  ORF Transcript_130196/g.417852 Transcript_130196/m.417852 type:complete len:1033 (-) Transcript_130196:55-3153(-)